MRFFLALCEVSQFDLIEGLARDTRQEEGPDSSLPVIFMQLMSSRMLPFPGQVCNTVFPLYLCISRHLLLNTPCGRGFSLRNVASLGWLLIGWLWTRGLGSHPPLLLHCGCVLA